MTDQQKGFSLLELLLVLAIFIVVSGSVFQLMNITQLRYRAEQQFLESFQGARLGVEVIVRDIHNTGYPPPDTFAGNLPLQPGGPTPPTYPAPVPWTDAVGILPNSANPDLQRRFAFGIAGVDSSGGGAEQVRSTCVVDTITPANSTCDFPTPWDLFLELDIDPENPNPDPVTGLVPQVEWVRYNLLRPGGGNTSTLYRTVSPKVVGTPPSNNQSIVPFVENILQDPTQPVGAANPAVFTFECDPKQLIAPGVCLAQHIKNIYIAL
ncbi:MAG: PilW family protein, partial [Dehalococcoidia bacterium]